jgi:hypothetical protein
MRKIKNFRDYPLQEVHHNSHMYQLPFKPPSKEQHMGMRKVPSPPSGGWQLQVVKVNVPDTQRLVWLSQLSLAIFHVDTVSQKVKLRDTLRLIN